MRSRSNVPGLREALIGRATADYGELHQSHTLEIYKECLELADRVSSRRQNANSFFLTVNTALLGAVGYAGLLEARGSFAPPVVLLGVSGMVLCYLWSRIIRSHQQLNSAKFKVIQEIEKDLPVRPFAAEWSVVGRGKDRTKYWPFTRVEAAIPWVFFAAHGYVTTSSSVGKLLGPSTTKVWEAPFLVQ